MAEVYKRAGGYSIEELIARHEETQEGLRALVEPRAAKAEAIRMAHYAEGDSKIVVEPGPIDWTVSLDDTSGDRAAMSIEKGRRRYTIGPRGADVPEHGLDKNGRTVAGMKGINALGAAFDLPDDGREVF